MSKVFSVSTIPIKVRIPRYYLGGVSRLEYEIAYLVAVKAQNNNALGFSVHLESGALFSNLPIEALRYDDGRPDFNPVINLGNEILQPYSCIDGDVQFIQYEYLRSYSGYGRFGTEIKPIRYLFTLDYCGTGFASDPEQYKTHNIVYIEDESKHLAALPNNYCLWLDKHFTNNKECVFPPYKRGTIKYESGT